MDFVEVCMLGFPSSTNASNVWAKRPAGAQFLLSEMRSKSLQSAVLRPILLVIVVLHYSCLARPAINDQQISLFKMILCALVNYKRWEQVVKTAILPLT